MKNRRQRGGFPRPRPRGTEQKSPKIARRFFLCGRWVCFVFRGRLSVLWRWQGVCWRFCRVGFGLCRLQGGCMAGQQKRRAVKTRSPFCFCGCVLVPTQSFCNVPHGFCHSQASKPYKRYSHCCKPKPQAFTFVVCHTRSFFVCVFIIAWAVQFVKLHFCNAVLRFVQHGFVFAVAWLRFAQWRVAFYGGGAIEIFAVVFRGVPRFSCGRFLRSQKKSVAFWAGGFAWRVLRVCFCGCVCGSRAVLARSLARAVACAVCVCKKRARLFSVCAFVWRV